MNQPKLNNANALESNKQNDQTKHNKPNKLLNYFFLLVLFIWLLGEAQQDLQYLPYKMVLFLYANTFGVPMITPLV